MKKIYVFILFVFTVLVNAGYASASEKIVFVKEYFYNNPPVTGWFSDLWAINKNGSGAQQLTNFGVPYTVASPILSPDGQWIAFASSYESWKSAYYEDIFAIGTNGANLTRITGNEYATYIGTCTIQGLIIDNTHKDPLNEGQINLTCQGSTQYFHPTKVSDTIFSYSLSNVPVASGNKIWVKCCTSQYIGDLIFPVVFTGQTNTVTEMYLKNGTYTADYPGWSPDMSKLCGIFGYHSYDPTDSLDRSVVNLSVWGADGTQLGTRSATPPYDQSPRYSPDGTKIAFSYGGAFQQSLVTVPSNNLNATPTVLVQGFIDYGTLTYYSALYPAWSSDGKKIAFTVLALDSYSNLYSVLYVMKADLSDTTIVVPYAQNAIAVAPSFSLDGSELIYTLITSKSSYLNLINDIGTHNYTSNLWQVGLKEGKSTQITTDGLSGGGFCGNFNPQAIEEKPSTGNQNIKIEAFPNPFTTSVSVKLSGIGEKQKINLEICDISGRVIKTLTPKSQSPTTTITWDARNFPAGIYFLKLKSEGYEYTEKLILVR